VREKRKEQEDFLVLMFVLPSSPCSSMLSEDSGRQGGNITEEREGEERGEEKGERERGKKTQTEHHRSSLFVGMHLYSPTG